jgi:hypothetical protein
MESVNLSIVTTEIAGADPPACETAAEDFVARRVQAVDRRSDERPA